MSDCQHAVPENQYCSYCYHDDRARRESGTKSFLLPVSDATWLKGRVQDLQDQLRRQELEHEATRMWLWGVGLAFWIHLIWEQFSS